MFCFSVVCVLMYSFIKSTKRDTVFSTFNPSRQMAYNCVVLFKYLLINRTKNWKFHRKMNQKNHFVSITLFLWWQVLSSDGRIFQCFQLLKNKFPNWQHVAKFNNHYMYFHNQIGNIMTGVLTLCMYYNLKYNAQLCERKT